MSYVSASQTPDGLLDLNLFVQMHEIGLGPGSPDQWDAYPMLTPFMCEVLDTVMSPTAYKALHYHPDSFRRILSIDELQFDQLPIFKCDDTGFQLVESCSARAEYDDYFQHARSIVAQNRVVLAMDTLRGDIALLKNMAFAVSAGVDSADGRFMVRGFYPYFSSSIDSLQEHVFLYFHSELNRIVMAVSAAPTYAVQFMLQTGRIHEFDKICAWCGKTGIGLHKCPCKVVRYCGRECQRRHWASHAGECRAERARLGGGSV
jgi:hypothetical protein